MLCPRQGANCCYIDNVKLLQDLIKIVIILHYQCNNNWPLVAGIKGEEY